MNVRMLGDGSDRPIRYRPSGGGILIFTVHGDGYSRPMPKRRRAPYLSSLRRPERRDRQHFEGFGAGTVLG